MEALGQSEIFLEFQDRLSRVAPVNRPVLLLGERGTGKELAAARLHYLSTRWQGSFVTLNCAALSPTLIEAELFGFEKGAFTGATQRRRGRFESANNGTLFLDEVGIIPIEVQEKILRVVEYSTFERVGSSESIDVDVRIIAATNADMKELVRTDRFKQDLLDRLSFEVLFLPPLRARGEDILILADHFAARMAFEMGRETLPKFSTAAVEALTTYDWPGNIRELKNVVERAVYRAEGSMISTVVFDPFVNPFERPTPEAPTPTIRSDNETPVNQHTLRKPFKAAIDEFKLKLLEDALRAAQFNQKKAAAILALTYHQFRGLYRRYRKQLSSDFQ